MRDFVYVKDVLKVCYWLMRNSLTDYIKEQGSLKTDQSSDLKVGPQTSVASGIYNLGTGKARSFEDLVKSTFAALDTPARIQFIDMPEDIRSKYQYFTEANMSKLRKAGYQEPFYSLESGIDDYVRTYLAMKKYY